MTPFQLFRETPARVRSLPTVWAVLACSIAAMFVAVVLMAWHTSQVGRHRCSHGHTYVIEVGR